MISDLYLSHAFDLFDLNDDLENAGQIPIEQLQSVMCGAISTKKKISIEQWQSFIQKFDENNDKLIDYNEFKNMMMSFHENFADSAIDLEIDKKISSSNGAENRGSRASEAIGSVRDEKDDMGILARLAEIERGKSSDRNKKVRPDSF
jgi:Ca2+-binding EF-hand superfamily protein